jgi:hemerythrin-like domain-containing protein
MRLASTSELHEEHEAIKVALSVLAAVGKGMERGAEGAEDDAGRLLRFFSTFGDGCHHSKEERHFFPAVEATRLPYDQECIDSLVEEHREGREYISAMQSQLQLYREGERRAGAAFRQQAEGYGEMLRSHIEVEEEELLGRAEAAFSGSEDRRLAVEFERLEQQEIGQGVHEEFHALLDELEKKYLQETQEKEEHDGSAD